MKLKQPNAQGKRAGRSGRLVQARDRIREERLFIRRAVVSFIFVALGLSALVGRLVYLQVFNHQYFTTLSENNRVSLQPLPPTRGLIYDRNGVLLAENRPSHRLEIVPEQVDDIDATLQRLSTYITISESDLRRFRRLVGRSSPYVGTPLRFGLSDAEVARLAVNLHRMPGVNIKADLSRRYPLEAVAGHILGYVGRIDERELKTIDTSQYSGTTHIGKTGIEKTYEDILHGEVGYQQVETNAQGRVLRVLSKTPPVPGKNLYLTIDIEFQRAAELALGDYTGAIVALDPRNGDVLALVSMPNYDPNPFVNGIDYASYKALNTSPDRPLFNRALYGAYPPGSTIKPMMVLAGLEAKVFDRRKSVYCPGYFKLPNHDRRFRDWRRGGHGTVSLSKAIVESCDVYFYQLALDMGIDRMNKHLSEFGFGQRTGIDLYGEKSGVLPSQEWKRKVHKQPWYAGETIIAGIGQGYMLATPLQLAHATSAVAMRGQQFAPQVVHAVQEQGSDKLQIKTGSPLDPVHIADPLSWDVVIQAMVKVVHSERGTARRIARGIAYTAAGKTGTAQVFSLGEEEEYDAEQLARRLHDHALFIAFAPAEQPQIAIAVIAEHGGGGGSVAAPIGRQVLDAYLLQNNRLTQGADS